jgi:hypothetical protein
MTLHDLINLADPTDGDSRLAVVLPDAIDPLERS